MKSIVPERKYQICNRCVMDTSDPWIVFDEKGVCNHCTEFLGNRLKTISHRPNDNKNLEEMFNMIKRSRKKKDRYDVIVGVSGGVDSSTTLLLAQEAGLKILAVHMDNCWDTPIAIKNINKLIALENVDYKCEVLDWQYFKNFQKAFIESGLPDIELPTDIAILKVINKYAIKYKIRNILCGGNLSNEGILPASWMYNPRDSKFSESVIKKYNLSVKVFNKIKFGFFEEFNQRIIHRIKTFYPLNQYNYDKNTAKTILEKKLNFESYEGKHCESTYTRFCQLIYQPKRNKIDYRRPHLSTDICFGRIKRSEAINLLKVPAWDNLDVEADLKFVALKLGYKVEELENIMTLPLKWYVDYPNRKRILGFIYDLYRILTNTKKATNF